MRTIVDIPDEQIQQLAELCRREALSRPGAVRRAIALLLTDHAPGRTTRSACGRTGTDGVWYQQLLRGEWDRRDRSSTPTS